MNKTNTELVSYARAQLTRPYWYGTYGQTATKELYESKKKQYPDYYTANDFEGQFGQRVHDCGGLIEGYLMSETADSKPKYVSKYDYSANSLRKACKEKGDIETIPEIPGVLVFFTGHVGVYAGNGKVIEARGHKYGVVETKLKSRPWLWWGKHPDIEYVIAAEGEKEIKTVTIELAQLQKGAKGEEVKTLQRLLNALGFKGKTNKSLTVDGDMGSQTDFALREYQAKSGLTVDGIVGQKTWNKLLKG